MVCFALPFSVTKDYAKWFGISTTFVVLYNLYKLCSFNSLSRMTLSLAVVCSALPKSTASAFSTASHSAHKPQFEIFMTQTFATFCGSLFSLRKIKID